MRETPKAQQAFNDYLKMGPERSLEKLLSCYREQTESGKTGPTLRMATLTTWSVAHQWQARLAEIAEAERQAIVARGIAEKQNRVDALNDRWDRMRRVIAERADAAEFRSAAGGGTGLLVRTFKQIGSGEKGQLVDEFAVDTGLLKEMREHEKQAAIEMSQWTEKRELTGKDGGPLELEIVERIVSADQSAPEAESI